MVKTTIYLDPQVALVLRQMAKAQDKSQAELTRAALAIYTQDVSRPKPRRKKRYCSGRFDVPTRAEDLLRQAIWEGQWP
jgi:hypothetical protein